jgi:hypothetical protein
LCHQEALLTKILGSAKEWHELEGVAASITSSHESDALIWQYENKGGYLTSSVYAIINFGGVTLVHIPTIWQLIIT